MKKVLIVDDEPDILEAAAFRIKTAGYEVISAVDGLTGLTMVKQERPDLVLLDLALPGLSGREVCRRIKQDEELKAIPVVLFTASVSDVTLEEKTVSIGADDFLVKPFEPQELIAKIRKFLG